MIAAVSTVGYRRKATANRRARRVDDCGEDRPVSGNTTLMQIPGVHIETLHNPTRYSYAQIEKACTLAALLNRGKLVLVEPPRGS
jgi:hypothetical protein